MTGLDFGNFKATTINGNIYNDLNGNGLHELGRAGPCRLDRGPGRFERQRAGVGHSPTPTAITRSPDVGGGTYIVAEVVPTELGPDPAALSDRLQLHHPERPEPVRPQLRRPRLSGLDSRRGHRQRPARLLGDRHVEHRRRRLQRHQPRRQDRPGLRRLRDGLVGLHGIAFRFLRGLHHLRGQEHLLETRLRSRSTMAAPSWAQWTSTSRSW